MSNIDPSQFRNPAGGPMLREMPVGTKLLLRDESIVEIVGNPGNGGWLNIKYIESKDEDYEIGDEEWIFFADVKDILE